MLLSDASKLSVIVFALTDAERSAADCLALDVSAIVTFVLVATGRVRFESEYRMT